MGWDRMEGECVRWPCRQSGCGPHNVIWVSSKYCTLVKAKVKCLTLSRHNKDAAISHRDEALYLPSPRCRVRAPAAHRCACVCVCQRACVCVYRRECRICAHVHVRSVFKYAKRIILILLSAIGKLRNRIYVRVTYVARNSCSVQQWPGYTQRRAHTHTRLVLESSAES